MLSLIPVLLAALAAGILLPVLLRKKLKRPFAVLIGVGAFLLVTAGGMLVYLNIHYSADQTAVQAFAQSDGDGEATVSPEEQQCRTAQAIIALCR